MPGPGLREPRWELAQSALINHPEVLEAAVIGVPDKQWDERPLACVVRKPGSRITADALKAYLTGRVASGGSRKDGRLSKKYPKPA